jgi:hypothetical protein
MKILDLAIEELVDARPSGSLSTGRSALVSELAICVGEVGVKLHPLGFYHAELTPLAPGHGRRVRLHVWDGKVQADSMGLVHDHMWSLTSAVLAGGITNIIFDAVVDRDGPHDGVRVRYGAENMFESESRYSITESRREEIRAMQVYKVPARVVHSTLVTNFPTVTLAVTMDESDDRGPLIFSSGESLGGTAVRASGDPSYISSILHSLGAGGSLSGH